MVLKNSSCLDINEIIKMIMQKIEVLLYGSKN